MADVNVGFLSGIYSRKYSDTPEPKRNDAKQRIYRHRSEMEQLTRIARRHHGRVDVLLTHDRPSGVGTSREGRGVSDSTLRELSEAVRPRVHACGHMHHDHPARIGATQVVCLAKPRNTPRRVQGVAVVERDRRRNLQVLN
ncbi:MAG: hypothetical protein OXS29_00635 [bacterium]|nr:hypothetical protein [bacterium]MDE0290246.1 hypothetical protein [bacterium]MDE0438756.1 hypothetical protein [bacterium]